MLANFGPVHMIVLLIIIILLFGAPKLPGMARSLGQSMRIFKSEVEGMKNDNKKDETTTTDNSGTGSVVSGEVIDNGNNGSKSA